MPYACPRQQGYCIVRRQRHAGPPEECVAVSQRCGGALDRRRRADSSGAAWSSARRWPEGTDARLPPPPAFVPDPFPRVAAQLDSLSCRRAPRAGRICPSSNCNSLARAHGGLARARGRRDTREPAGGHPRRGFLGSSAQTTMDECESHMFLRHGPVQPRLPKLLCSTLGYWQSLYYALTQTKPMFDKITEPMLI